MPTDRILVEGITFYGYHGLLDDERRDGRTYSVDLSVGLNLRSAGHSDALGDTVDYRTLAQIVVDLGVGQRFDLLEALAEAMAQAILARCPGADLVLRLRKHGPRIAGNPAWAAVEIRRGGA